MPRFQEGNLERNLAVTARLAEMAAARGVEVASMAIAWILAQGGHLIPLVGTSRADHVERGLEALTIDLSAADLAAIDALAPRGAASGERYPGVPHAPARGLNPGRSGQAQSSGGQTSSGRPRTLPAVTIRWRLGSIASYGRTTGRRHSS